MTKVYSVAGAAILILALLTSTASGNPMQFTHDYYQSGGWDIGDGSPARFEIWEIGSRIYQGRLEFSIWMDLPKGGAWGEDSYEYPTGVWEHLLSPGDLWITIGSTNPFAAGATRHAIALTTHANVVPQKYHDANGNPDVWQPVTEGRLYKDAQFSTGTFEEYQQTMNNGGYWYSPDDQDGDDTKNSYMCLIMDFGEEVTGHSSVTWTLEPYWGWDPELKDGEGDWYLVDSWRVTGYVDLDQIGLSPWMSYSVFVSSECGNDGAGHGHPVPEAAARPLLVLASLLALRRRRLGRRRR